MCTKTAILFGKMETKTYKWSLRRGGRKMRCPKCGQMRFVPYVLTADMSTLAGDEYGRCDREQNCGYHRYPSEVEAKDVTPIVQTPKEPLRFFPCAVVTDVKTNLFDYAANLCGISHACKIWDRYKIGRDGERTVFWQIAFDGSIRAGKSIPYLTNGHRDKNDPYPANWLHKSKAWKHLHTGEELQQCWFGEHLLREYPDKPVVIVESEKTAAIMSEYSKKWIWLASGGAQGLKNEEKNKVLKGRDVWLLPDNGMYWNWATVAHANGWNIFDTLEKASLFDGCDVLDLLEAGSFGEEFIKTPRR